MIDFIIGVDPGNSGAIARYDLKEKSWLVLDVPTVKVERKAGTKTFVDHAGLGSLMRAFCAPGGCLAYVEQVSSRTGQGVVSVFTFGYSYGAVKQSLGSENVNMVDVPPAVWKRSLGIPVGADKEYSRQLALRMWPAYAPLLKRKKDNGRAEAMLIAAYGTLHCGAAR